MPSSEKKILKGYIVLVQEDRFRIVDDTGRGYLLTLSVHAGASQTDLEHWSLSGERLIVEYEGEPNLESGIAREVRPLSSYY
ncbi:MAG: hypothetical protein ACLGPL_08160 [Acidobacteriota bacterium]